MADVITLTGDNPNYQIPDSRVTDPLTVLGTTGDNVIKTGVADDTIRSNAGNDTINAGQGINNVTGGPGNDVINAGLSNGGIYDGGTGNDRLTIGSTDTVRAAGGPGNDTIIVQANVSDATVAGGSGNDLVLVQTSSTIKVNAGEDNDIVRIVRPDYSPDATGSSLSGGLGYDVLELRGAGNSATIGGVVTNFEAVIGEKKTAQTVALQLNEVGRSADSTGLTGGSATRSSFAVILGDDSGDQLTISGGVKSGLGTWSLLGDVKSAAASAYVTGVDAAVLKAAGVSDATLSKLSGFVYVNTVSQKYVTVWTDLAKTNDTLFT